MKNEYVTTEEKQALTAKTHDYNEAIRIAAVIAGGMVTLHNPTGELEVSEDYIVDTSISLARKLIAKARSVYGIECDSVKA